MEAGSESGASRFEGPDLRRIGTAAAESGVTVRTIRFYERAGLIVPYARTAAGYRLFDNEAIKRLRFIRHARLLGLGLDEIQTVLAIRDGGQAPCRHIQQLLNERIEQVDAQLESLLALRQDLSHLVDELHDSVDDRDRDDTVCPCFDLVFQT